MREPNFFIIGAPKCGTTALSEYLRTHSRIFMSALKEPNYFACEMDSVNEITTLDKYLALFEEAEDTHQAVGEGSVHYLRSSDAIPRVIERYPDARFIVMFRDPITFLPSWHNQMRYSLTEDEPVFSRAWALQEERKQGRHVPPHCHHPMFMDYLGAAKFGGQTQRLLRLARREQVLFLKFEDFVADIRGHYLRVLEFLGVDDDGRDQFDRVNAAHQHRNRLIGYAMKQSYRFLNRINPFERDHVVRTCARSVLLRLKEWNTTYERPQPMSTAMEQEVRELLREDMALLRELTGITWDTVRTQDSQRTACDTRQATT